MTEVLYLFCLAHMDKLNHFCEPEIHLHFCSQIAAVFHWVKQEEFCSAEAEARMQNLAWLTPRIHYHEQVIEKIMRYSPVLPARFGTLFSSLASLENFITQQAAGIEQFLNRVLDQEEWAVKGVLNRNTALAIFLKDLLSQEPTPESPGARYFQERSLQLKAEKQVKIWLKQTCQDVAKTLLTFTTDFSKRQIVTQPEDREIVANWALLLPRTTIGECCAKIDQINTHYAAFGLTFEYSGPWPPYSFTNNVLTSA